MAGGGDEDGDWGEAGRAADMTTWIEAHALWLRGESFLAVFVVMAIAEAVVEARPRRVARRTRWPHNLALMILNTALPWNSR